MLLILKKYFNIYIPLFLLGLLSVLTLWGINKPNLALRQFFYFSIGFFIIVVFNQLRVNFFHKKFLIIFSCLIFILMLIAYFFGYKKAWINFYLFSFQPIEFLKIVFILSLAYFLKNYSQIKNLIDFLPLAVILGITFILIYFQKDMGSFLIFFIIWFLLVINYLNLRLKILIITLSLALVLISWLFILKDYQKERIFNFIFPKKDIFGSGYNAFQSKITFVSGGILGKGFGGGFQSIYGFLPSASTDFLLAAFSEQFGFVGFFIFLIIFAYFWHELNNLKKFLKQPEKIIFLNGIKIWYLIQFFVNSFMNIGLFPIIGVPFPFFSYGGSHILAEFLALAMILP